MENRDLGPPNAVVIHVGNNDLLPRDLSRYLGTQSHPTNNKKIIIISRTANLDYVMGDV
jgi:hypothetical protein